MASLIQIEGLKEVRAAVKELKDLDTSREFKAAGVKVAAMVTVKAQGKAAGLGKMQAKAATTIRPASVATGSAVRFGGNVPFAMGAEFGAGHNVPRNKRRGTVKGWNQFEPWRRHIGYFLWPTIRSSQDEIATTYEDNIGNLCTRLFPGGA